MSKEGVGLAIAIIAIMFIGFIIYYAIIFWVICLLGIDILVLSELIKTILLFGACVFAFLCILGFGVFYSRHDRTPNDMRVLRGDRNGHG